MNNNNLEFKELSKIKTPLIYKNFIKLISSISIFIIPDLMMVILWLTCRETHTAYIVNNTLRRCNYGTRYCALRKGSLHSQSV